MGFWFSLRFYHLPAYFAQTSISTKLPYLYWSPPLSDSLPAEFQPPVVQAFFVYRSQIAPIPSKEWRAKMGEIQRLFI